MFYWLTELSDKISFFNVFPLHHLPHRRRDRHRACFRLPVRRPDHRRAASQARQRATDPQRWPAVPSRHQEGHADHGRADDPVRPAGVDIALGQPEEPLCVGRARGDAVVRDHRLLRRLSQNHEADRCRVFRPYPIDSRDGDRSARLHGDDASRPRSDFDIAGLPVLQGSDDQSRRRHSCCSAPL